MRVRIIARPCDFKTSSHCFGRLAVMIKIDGEAVFLPVEWHHVPFGYGCVWRGLTALCGAEKYVAGDGGLHTNSTTNSEMPKRLKNKRNISIYI